MSKIFTYEENGLSYTVTVYEQDDQIFADVTVGSGFMNVNAIYTADDDFSGPSAGLGGPLNMNGAGSRFEGERIQWDDAIAVSQPGLGHQDPDNPTFLEAGDTLTIELNADSIDDIDFVGIRATSTSTDGGSIKAVSGNPEIEEDNGDDDNGDDDNGDDDNGDQEDATYSKVFFVFDADAEIIGGFPYTSEDLPEDAEGTFADYLALFEDTDFADLDDINAVIFYTGEDLEEAFTLQGPFEDTDALLAAYDEAIQSADVEDLMVVLVGDDDSVADEDAENSDEDALVL